jgi:hypothetical protein
MFGRRGGERLLNSKPFRSQAGAGAPSPSRTYRGERRYLICALHNPLAFTSQIIHMRGRQAHGPDLRLSQIGLRCVSLRLPEWTGEQSREQFRGHDSATERTPSAALSFQIL